MQYCLCWRVGLVVVVGWGLGQLWGSKFALSMVVARCPFGTLWRSGCVVLGMCVVMVLLYDIVLVVLEC